MRFLVRASAVVARHARREARRGNAWGCVDLRGKLLQVWFFAQNPSEGIVGGLIRTFRVLPFPPLKFRPALIACLAPNVFLRNSLARFAANLFDACSRRACALYRF